MCKNRILVDGLFVVLCMAMVFSIMENAAAELRPVVMLVPYLISYCLIRVLFCLNYKWSNVALVAVITVLCIKELYEGYTQLFMFFGKKNGQDFCIGSFSNSGLYGCFLAVCSSMFVACCAKEKNRYIKIAFISLSVLSLLLLSVTMSRASVLSFAAAVLLLFFSIEQYRLFLHRNWIILSVLIMLFGTGAYIIKKPSADGRMLMNRIGLRIIKKNGLNSSGVGYYAGAYGAEQCAYFSEFVGDKDDDLGINNIPEGIRMVADSPYYAFNEYLKVGVEHGLVSVLLLIALVVIGIVTSYKSGSCWCYPLLTLSVFALFSYPFETKIFLYMFTAFLASAGNNENNKVLNVTFYCLIVFVASIHLNKERRRIDNIQICSCQYDSNNLFVSQPNIYVVKDLLTGSDAIVDQNAFFNYGQAYNMSGDYNRSDSILKIGATVSSDPMFWNVMGNNSLALGNYREAEKRYRHAFYMVPNRLYPLYLLAKLYHTEGDTVQFLKMADLVESFIPKVESVNTERLRNEIAGIKDCYLKDISIE